MTSTVTNFFKIFSSLYFYFFYFYFESSVLNYWPELFALAPTRFSCAMADPIQVYYLFMRVERGRIPGLRGAMYKLARRLRALRFLHRRDAIKYEPMNQDNVLARLFFKTEEMRVEYGRRVKKFIEGAYSALENKPVVWCGRAKPRMIDESQLTEIVTKEMKEVCGRCDKESLAFDEVSDRKQIQVLVKLLGQVPEE